MNSLISTPERTRNLKRFEGEPRECANKECVDYRGIRNKVSRYHDSEYCGQCVKKEKHLVGKQEGEEDESNKRKRRHGTGVLRLVGLGRMKDQREITFGQLAVACRPLCVEAKREFISDATLTNWNRGRYLVPVADAEIIAKVLRCTVGDLTILPDGAEERRFMLKGLGRVKDASGKSWAQLAIATGSSVPGLKHWAGRGQHQHTCARAKAQNIAHYLGVTLEDLTREE